MRTVLWTLLCIVALWGGKPTSKGEVLHTATATLELNAGIVEWQKIVSEQRATPTLQPRLTTSTTSGSRLAERVKRSTYPTTAYSSTRTNHTPPTLLPTGQCYLKRAATQQATDLSVGRLCRLII